MSIIDSILNVFLGDKGKKDVKEVTPIVNSILKIEEDLKNISNDDLRSITNNFKKEIQELKNPFYDKIEKIKETISQSENIDENEKRYNEIEKVENNYLDSLDKYLDSILPKAFAVIKETTKRFNNNIEIIVKSTPFDEKISWEGHLSGFIIGTLFSFIFKSKSINKERYDWELGDYKPQEDPFMRQFDENGNFIDSPNEDDINID